MREPTEHELAEAAKCAFIKPEPSGDEVRAALSAHIAEQTRLYNEANAAKTKTAKDEAREVFDAACAKITQPPSPEEVAKGVLEQLEINRLHAQQEATRKAQALTFAHAQNMHR